MTIYTYSLSSTFQHPDYDAERLFSELSASLSGAVHPGQIRQSGDDVSIYFDSTLTTEQETVVYNTLTSHVCKCEHVPSAKQRRYHEIDDKTDALIAAGFPYDGYIFSLSITAQLKLLGMNQLRNEVYFTYPVAWNDLYDDNRYSITSSDHLYNFYLTAVGEYRNHIDTGTALKELVSQQTTVSGVMSIVDDR